MAAGTLLSSEYMYNGRLINLRLDRVALPNGRETVREIVEHPGAVAVVPLDERGNVTLVRQFRDPARARLLEVPAGTRQHGEAAVDCAQRELQEETGLQAGKLERIAGFYVSPGYCTEYIEVFLATDLSPSTRPADEDEFIDVMAMPLADAAAKIESGEIEDAKTVASLLIIALQCPSGRSDPQTG